MDRIEFLKSLEFSEYESKILASFMQLQTATPKQISQDSGVPQNKIYPLVKGFEHQGILSKIPANTKTYQLINFKSFIDKKIRQKEENLNQLKQDHKNFEDLKQPEHQHIFSLIRGQKAIMDKLAEENSRAEKEIWGMNRNWVVWGEGLREMQKAIKRGVQVKLIGEINEETKSRAQEWKNVGCKIKAYNKKFGEYPLRFSIIDNKQARITLGKPEIKNPKDYITIWTKSKPLIAILKTQFQEMWKECKSF